MLPQFPSSFGRSKFAALPLFCAFALACAACGDDTTPPEEQGLPFDQFPEAYREAQCEHATICGFMPDRETCLDALSPDAVVVQATAAVAWGDLTYDPNAGLSCVEAIRTASCEATSLYPRELRQNCDAVFGNRRGQDEPCFASIECQGLDAVCEGACGDGCCQGACKLAGGFVAEGGLCDGFNPCNPESVCLFDEMSMTNICVKRSKANEACVPDSCIDGHFCDPSTAKCFQQAKTGAQCNPALLGACGNIGEYCDEAEGKCKPKPGEGEACAANPAAMGICANYTLCDGTTCRRLPVSGEECPQGLCLGDFGCNTDAEPFVCNPIAPSRACVILK